MNSDRVRLSLRTDAPAAMLMRRARRAPCAAQCRALAVLAHRWVPSPPPAVGPTAPPARALGGVLVCLHGILGSKSNWLTPARKMLDAADRLRGAGAAEWRALCLDHRGHADSADSPPGADPEAPVAAGGGGKDRVAVGIGVCADDVEETLRTLGLVGAAGDVPIVIVGHSFGGKVALELARRTRDGAAASPTSPSAPRVHGGLRPLHVFAVDSNPAATDAADEVVARPAGGAAAAPAEMAVSEVLRVVEAVCGAAHDGDDGDGAAGAQQRRFGSRGAMQAALEAAGLSGPLAAWVAQSARPAAPATAGAAAPAVRLAHDLRVVRALYESHRRTDLWAALATGPAGAAAAPVTVVVGGRNRAAWGAAALARLDACARAAPRGAVAVAVVERAGHNVHVDDLDALVALVAPSLAAS